MYINVVYFCVKRLKKDHDKNIFNQLIIFQKFNFLTSIPLFRFNRITSWAISLTVQCGKFLRAFLLMPKWQASG